MKDGIEVGEKLIATEGNVEVAVINGPDLREVGFGARFDVESDIFLALHGRAEKRSIPSDQPRGVALPRQGNHVRSALV